jgi:hypothetical protein
MRAVRVPVVVRRAGEPRATGLFVVTAAVVAALVAFVPHTPRAPFDPTAPMGMNAILGTNVALLRTYVHPQPGARSYGIMTRPLRFRAGGGVLASAWIRPMGAPGGRACLAVVAVHGRPLVPAGSKHECVPLVAGWIRLPALTLRTAASGYGNAEITVHGNDGGFEARRPAVIRIAP